MRRLLTRISAALGLALGATFLLVYGIQFGDVTMRRAVADVRLTWPDGGQVTRSMEVAVACDGGRCVLPDERIMSCVASAKFMDGSLSQRNAFFDLCVDGGTPSHRIEFTGFMGTPQACDNEICDGGMGLREVAGDCRCQPFPVDPTCKLLDGGLVPQNMTVAADQTTGCEVDRACVVFAHGGSGYDEGMPAACRNPDGGGP